jgi:hypothetical protein
VAPCGIPLTAAPPELEVVVAAFVVVVAAFVVVVAGADVAVDEVAGAAVEVCAAGAEDWVDEVDELEPQAATPTATSTSRPGASRRIDLLAFTLMCCSSSCASEFFQPPLRTPKRLFLFPAR